MRNHDNNVSLPKQNVHYVIKSYEAHKYPTNSIFHQIHSTDIHVTEFPILFFQIIICHKFYNSESPFNLFYISPNCHVMEKPFDLKQTQKKVSLIQSKFL